MNTITITQHTPAHILLGLNDPYLNHPGDGPDIMLPQHRRDTMTDMSPHVSTVFKELFDELKSMKQQQWTITNYGLLILLMLTNYALHSKICRTLAKQRGTHGRDVA